MWIGLLLIFCLYFFDQGTKLLVEQTMMKNEIIDVIPDFFYFTRVYNTGAAWSSFNDATYVLAILSFIGTIVLAYFFTKIDWKKKKVFSIAICMCVAGCFGNFVDRFLYCIKMRDGVVDFIGFQFGTYTFPIFNIADICLTVGMILIAIEILFLDEIRKKKHANHN